MKKVTLDYMDSIVTATDNASNIEFDKDYMSTSTYSAGMNLGRDVSIELEGETYNLSNIMELLLKAYLPMGVDGDKVRMVKVSELIKNE